MREGEKHEGNQEERKRGQNKSRDDKQEEGHRKGRRGINGRRIGSHHWFDECKKMYKSKTEVTVKGSR